MSVSLDLTSIARSEAFNRALIKNNENIHEFCQRTGEDYSSIYKYLHKSLKIGDKVARKLEFLLGLNPGELDAEIPKELVTYVPVISNSFKANEDLNDLLVKKERLCSIKNDVIEAFGWNKETLAILVAKDDSMEPTIIEGAEIIIDYSQTDIKPNKVYAVRIFQDIYVRRVNKSPLTGNIILIPDSLAYENKTTFEKLELDISSKNYEIIGRAVFLNGAL